MDAGERKKMFISLDAHLHGLTKCILSLKSQWSYNIKNVYSKTFLLNDLAENSSQFFMHDPIKTQIQL